MLSGVSVTSAGVDSSSKGSFADSLAPGWVTYGSGLGDLTLECADTVFILTSPY